jgi:hypothetical protein
MSKLTYKVIAATISSDPSSAMMSLAQPATTRSHPVSERETKQMTDDELDHRYQKIIERLRRHREHFARTEEKIAARFRALKAPSQTKIRTPDVQRAASNWPPPMPPRPVWRGSDAAYCADWRDYERKLANPHLRH